MKKTPLIFLAIILAFISCSKDNVTPTPEDPKNNSDTSSTTENSSALWQYEIDEYDALLTDLVLDNNDNSYFFARANNEYVLYSLDKNGALRWNQTIPDGSYSNSEIMLAGDKLILSYQWDVIAAYNINDGSQIWSTTLSISFSDMAYSNGTIYVAQSTTFNTESQISALEASSGTVKWDYKMDKHVEAKISVYQNDICVVTDFRLPWPWEIGLTVLTDNGTGATESWRDFKPYDPNEVAANPYRASFDGLGNLYYEEAVADTTCIHAYKVSDGTVNWEKKLCDFGLTAEPIILFGNGIVTASYKSDESWRIGNSHMTLDASTGNTIKQNDDIILEDAQILLTSDYSTVVFNRLLDDAPTMQVYGSNGDLSSSISAGFLGNSVLFSDCRITSEGNLIIIESELMG